MVNIETIRIKVRNCFGKGKFLTKNRNVSDLCLSIREMLKDQECEGNG